MIRFIKLNKLYLAAGMVATSLLPVSGLTQDTVEWTTLGNDFAHTRYTPAENITAENFHELEVAWTWDGSSFQAQSGRSTPSYISGRLFTVAGARRHVIAIDPKTGETIWSYREPNTERFRRKCLNQVLQEDLPHHENSM
jgi:glucose dehydrogenase